VGGKKNLNPLKRTNSQQDLPQENRPATDLDDTYSFYMYTIEARTKRTGRKKLTSKGRTLPQDSGDSANPARVPPQYRGITQKLKLLTREDKIKQFVSDQKMQRKNQFWGKR